MAQEKYNDYLGTRILVEHKPVTYKLLSRAFKINVNTAKRILFEFHKKQNAKKLGSVHATYLVTGTPRKVERTNGVNGLNGEDTDMRSSPFVSSMPEPEEESEDSDYTSESDDENTAAPKGVKETQIVLVREEQLEETRAGLEESSMHIYSLEYGPLENLHVLAYCNKAAATQNAGQDPLKRWQTYGSIQNPYIKKRIAQKKPPAGASTSKSTTKPTAKPVAKPAATTAATTAAKPATTAVAKLGAKEKEASAPSRRGSASEDNASGRTTPQPAAGPSTLKRTDSKSGARKDKTTSDIFKSFAKAKPKSKEATPAPVEDEPMQGMSEDEGDADDEPEVKVDEEKNEAARKAREDRAERLRKMMEDDDEEMPDAPAADTPVAAVGTPEPVEEEPTVTVSNGRRRGRRRVMKKKKVKDEDGYLVTKEEAVWESFSEDEPVPKKLKPAPAKPAAKGKNAVKKGQGSIASFFKKA